MKYQHHDSSNCKKDAGPWPVKICQCNNKEWMIEIYFSQPLSKISLKPALLKRQYFSYTAYASKLRSNSNLPGGSYTFDTQVQKV
jgi:hypothetical protein